MEEKVEHNPDLLLLQGESFGDSTLKFGEGEYDLATSLYDDGRRFVIGGFYELSRNVEKGLDLLFQAAELGCEGAKWDLQCLISSEQVGATERKEGEPVPVIDWNQALQIYRREAKKDNPLAVVNIGVCYDKGYGVPCDRSVAFKFFRKAARLGSCKGIYNLGAYYDRGLGTTSAPALGLLCFQEAARRNYPAAIFYMGVCYTFGKGVAHDQAKGQQLYLKAAEMGMPVAMRYVADCFFHKRDQTQNALFQALRFYIKGSTEGDIDCWKGLSRCIVVGLKNGAISEKRPKQRRESESHDKAEEIDTGDQGRTAGMWITEEELPQPPALAEAGYVVGEYSVPCLYDVCCLHFYLRYRRDARARERMQQQLPEDVNDRLRLGVLQCANPYCCNVFFGKGRVQRTFIRSVSSEEEEEEEVEEDAVLRFCSTNCFQALLNT
ncbi:hypothetical protein QOT17_001293 [Balamuthia mandrillaris]